MRCMLMRLLDQDSKESTFRFSCEINSFSFETIIPTSFSSHANSLGLLSGFE